MMTTPKTFLRNSPRADKVSGFKEVKFYVFLKAKPAAVFTLARPLSCSLYNGDVKTALDMETIANILLRVIVLTKTDIKTRLTPKSIIKEINNVQFG